MPLKIYVASKSQITDYLSSELALQPLVNTSLPDISIVSESKIWEPFGSNRWREGSPFAEPTQNNVISSTD